MKNYRSSIIVIIVVLAVFFSFSGASAQDGDEPVDKVRELVFHVNAYNGLGWQGVFHPQSADTIYLLAGHNNTLTPRYTMVYFWTITQRYKADYGELNEVIDSRLDIRKGGRQVAVLDLEDYVIQDSTRTPRPDTMRLFVREEAYAQRQFYLDQLDAWWEALQDYYAIPRLERPDEEPDPPDMFSTELTQGFIINLEAGTYHARLLDENGQAIPDSEKTLVIFAPRRTGVGYIIIPESKWTVPDQSATTDGVIYTRDELRLFLTPHFEMEINDHHYKKMLDPQLPLIDNGAWEWIPLTRLGNFELQLEADDQVSRTPFLDYKVHQAGEGGVLGYTIDLYDPKLDEDLPSFSGHDVQVSLVPGEEARIVLVDKDGNMVPGSERYIRGLRHPFRVQQYSLALLPVLIAGGLMVRRSRRRQRTSVQQPSKNSTE